ncbi:MAG: NifB/NifX family molybdenum-iron cluster-binding protein [Bacteroidales bacterium]
MKVAITSTGNSPDSTLDPRFGRCAYFVIYDTQSGSTEFIPNPAREAEDGAGPEAVKLVASRDAKKIISGEFGMKIKPLLDSMKIQMIVIKDPGKRVSDVIEMLNH